MLDYEIIIVCLDYSDYLRLTLPRNIKHTKRINVVTAWDDKDTINICKDNGCRIIFSDRIRDKSKNISIAKGKAINDAILSLDLKEWVLLIDSDIILPRMFNYKINDFLLEKDMLYYTRRWGPKDIHGIDQTLWEFDLGLEIKQIFHAHADKEIAERTRRHGNAIECFPFGYFQLFNKNAESLKRRDRIYEETYSTAGMDDHIFGHFVFPTDKRSALPEWEFDVIHLPHGPYMQNWSGRVSQILPEALK